MIRLKNEQEIAGIRKSCHLLADMFNDVIPRVRAGMSTKEVDTLCENFIRAHGGTPAWHREGFPGTACISVNDEVIHGIPSNTKIIHDGDLVSLDVGIDLDGYISDSTHTIQIGTVRPEWKRLHEVTIECLARAIAACTAGNRIKDISRAVNDMATAHGYGVVYEYCGHGVGLDVHEDPTVPNCPGRGPNPRIQAGMVLALEPMINLGTADVFTAENGWTVCTADGCVSVHEEHTVAVFADHTEVLTDLQYGSR
ncbi:MAG: type I methionyl aminopeptidase [Treponema sp.]|nr:type I methionyl aminopeptidase [Treponema sp.]